jgi:microcystin-dependent protein
MPFHTHSIATHNLDAGGLQNPAPDVILAKSAQGSAYQSNTSANLVMMAPQALSIAGGGQPHNNMQPYLTLNFCIAMQGVFPARP